MSKVFKDEKIFNKFKKQFKFIFKDEKFIELTKNHFNKNGSLAVFTIAFLQNRVGYTRILNSVRINSSDWFELFYGLYNDKTIVNALETISLNPIVSIENITQHFNCFDDFIERLISYVNEHNWDLNISQNDVKKLLSSAYGYLLYNSIECKLNNTVSSILEDVKYDEKYGIILNNTKLFALAKNEILKHCEQKINDLIVILLGGSNHLALNK